MRHSTNIRSQKKLKRLLYRVLALLLGGTLVLIVGVWGYLKWPRSLPPRPGSFTLIAHRGVSQTFPLDNLENDTCTAKIINPPTHNFLENTIPSIREAFKSGADIVEFDIHPTTDNQLVVFHDWTLDCRTNGRGITHEQSLETLKKLDIGYGYTADGGKTYPFRGAGIGAMPTVDEVMQAFPDRKFLINQKDTFERTAKLLATLLQNYPTQQQTNLYFFAEDEQYHQLKQNAPDVQKLFFTRKEIKDCAPQYVLMLFTGQTSRFCSQYALGLPARYLENVPGWPSHFLAQAQKANLDVYVIDVDTLQDLERVKELPLTGITTNRIEIIGPRLKP